MYDSISDEELVEMVRSGDAEAENALIDRYKETARARASLYYMLGADSDDVIQEGMVGLIRAIRSYDPARGASFATFAGICINRRILSAVKSAGRLKNSPLNESLSLDIPLDGDPARTLTERIPADSSTDPEALLLLDELNRRILGSSGLLSDLEQQVVRGLIEGNDYRHIAGELGRSHKSVDNAIQRIRRKLQSFFSEEG